MKVTTEGGREWLQIILGVGLTCTSIYIAFALLIQSKSYSQLRLPPGPRGWPVLGSLLSLSKDAHVSFYNLSKEYGPLMFMHLGSVPTLVVSSPEMAKEVLKTHDHIMASRVETTASRVLAYNHTDLAFAPYGEHWRHMRKVFTVELLTAFRINQFKTMRQREVIVMLQSVLQKSKEGKATNMSEPLSQIATNNIAQMMMNKRYCGVEGDSAPIDGFTFQATVREILKVAGAFTFADYIPFLYHLDLQGVHRRIKATHQRLDKFLEGVVTEHRNRQPSSIRTQERWILHDFVDLLLTVPRQNDSDELLSNDTIKAMLSDGIIAGTSTTSDTLEWALAELLKHPDMMRRAQEELDSVVGRDRLVEEADISQLNYLQAVVKEVFRLHPPGPLLIPHKSTQDCEIAGYHIPAGVNIIVNVWAIQNDPAVWERPREFDPNRFLDSAIDVKGHNYNLLPFGSGRRMCPAMNFGLLGVQFTLSLLLQAINWALPNDQKPEDLDMSAVFGLGLPKAVPLTAIAKPRLATNVIYASSQT